MYFQHDCISTGVKMGEACSIVLRGATKQILDEAERSLHDALCVLQQTVKETRICYGGGPLSRSMSNQFVNRSLKKYIHDYMYITYIFLVEQDVLRC